MSELEYKGRPQWYIQTNEKDYAYVVGLPDKDHALETEICTVYCTNYPEVKAHLKLIACAPELLFACQKILETDYGCAPSAGYMDELKKICETAVKKALE